MHGAGMTARAGAALAAVAAALAVIATWLATAATVLGADPTASPAGGDVRTTPAAPGVVGDPLLAIAGVVIVGLATVAITLLAARLTARG